MPGLLRMVGRTAAIVGTANAVSHRQQERWAGQDQQSQAAAYQQQYAQPPQQYAPAPPEPEPQPAADPALDPTVAKIDELAALHTQGVLTDEEFTAAKAKVLGI